MKAAVLALLLSTTSASAAVYQWQWSGALSGSGTLTTAPLEGHVGFTPLGSFEHIISITGTIGGLTILGINESVPSNGLFADSPNLLDRWGFGFFTEPPDHFHPNPVGFGPYAAVIHGCDWTPAPCFLLEAREITFTYTHTYGDFGTFSLVPGPIVGAGLPGLLLAGAYLFTFLRRKRN